MRSSVRLWCHSRLNSPSHTSICAGNAGCVVHFIFLGSSSGDTWLFEDHTVNWSVLERQHRSLKVESQKAPPGSSFLPPFLQQKKKHLKSSVDCPKEFKRSQVRVTLWDLCVAHQMPCFSQASRAGGRRGQAWGLSEQLPDLSMNVAKEVHVGSSTVQAFILHQELTEHYLWFVLLPHDLELRGVKVRKCHLFLQWTCLSLQCCCFFKYYDLLFWVMLVYIAT